VVIATREKLDRLEALRVDTGDLSMDQSLTGYTEVIVGHDETVEMEVRC
jgi:predicted polyphosphate/ATP-dependent NAD kinase